MNTGLHDVWNLVWKLDLFLHGFTERLLDSYSIERLPVIKHVIETTDLLTKVMGTPNKLAQVLHDAVILDGVAPGAVPARLRAEDVRARHRLSGQPDRRGTREAVFRRVDAWRDGIGRRFLLMIGDDEPRSTREAVKQPRDPLATSST
jgi:hypothetical protein